MEMNPEKILLISFLTLLAVTRHNKASEVEDFKPEDHVRHSLGEPPPQVHEDGRCRCMCPNPVVANGTHSDRKIYVRSVLPKECNCAKVVLAQMGGIEPGSPKFAQMEDQFCPRCACKYETRKTGTIKVVVILVIVVIVSISVYGLFLACLDPWLKRKKNLYSEQSNEEICLQRSPFLPRDSDDLDGLADSEVSYKRGRSVFDRVGHQQSKWQRNVQQQRRNIYDRRTMLN